MNCGPNFDFIELYLLSKSIPWQTLILSNNCIISSSSSMDLSLKLDSISMSDIVIVFPLIWRTMAKSLKFK